MTIVDRVRDTLPNPTFEPIVGQPGYEIIKVLHRQLNFNTASIHTDIGNGRLEFLFLAVQLAVYNTLYHLMFVPPVNSGPTVAYPKKQPNTKLSQRTRFMKLIQYYSISTTLVTVPSSSYN